METKKYLTEAEVCAIFNIPVPTLRNRRHLRLGPPYCKIGKKVLYEQAKVEEYFLSCQHATAAAK